MPCVSGLDSVDTKWMWIICVKFLVDTLVLIRVSLQAANCAWPWLDINLKKALIRELLRQVLFNWCLYWGDATDWTWLDNRLLSEGIWFLLVLLGTSSASTCWFPFLCRYCWLTLHGFGPSAAFRFQVRVCTGLSCITNVALVLSCTN